MRFAKACYAVTRFPYAPFGMLMVLEIAPKMKGCNAAIMRMWLWTDRARLPVRPHGLAQSNTARCSGFRASDALAGYDL